VSTAFLLPWLIAEIAGGRGEVRRPAQGGGGGLQDEEDDFRSQAGSDKK